MFLKVTKPNVAWVGPLGLPSVRLLVLGPALPLPTSRASYQACPSSCWTLGEGRGTVEEPQITGLAPVALSLVRW